MFADTYYNIDILNAVDTNLDLHLYNILCMFDYPGFMVERASFMLLVPGLELLVEHFWKFRTDPADGMLVLNHLASYTIMHECFGLRFNSIPPT